MRIGIMLRHLGQHGGGVVVYTRQLLRHLLSFDTPHEFILLYQDPQLRGAFGQHERLRELALQAPSSLLWDQVAVRWAIRKERLDLLFNPKYSIPLGAACPTVFVCHGLDWYVMPWGSRWLDRLSHRYLIPRYAQTANAIIAVSQTVQQHAMEYLGVRTEQVHTVYHGVDDIFRQRPPQEQVEEVRRAYRLPPRFFLYCGQIYPPKNFARLLRAYAQVGPRLGIALVVAGAHTWLCEDEIQLVERLGLEQWVVWAGWIPHETLPAFYALAEALLLPSLYEACGLPLLEAMASGCPVVTANRYGPKELVDQAGILVDPEDVESIANGLQVIATQPQQRQCLIAAGRERAQEFTWERCARETLRVLESVGAQS